MKSQLSYRRIDVYVLIATTIIVVRYVWFLLDWEGVVFLLGHATVPAPVTYKQYDQQSRSKDHKGDNADDKGPEHPHGGQDRRDHGGIGLPQAIRAAGIAVAALSQGSVGVAARLAHARGGVHTEPPDADGALRGGLARTAKGLAFQAHGRIRIVSLRT